MAGKRRGFDDTRGTLFFEIARIAQVKRPRLLLLENVKGLLSHDKGRTFRTILATLDELGYDAEWEVLNSKHFGVPQNRERVFVVGHLRGVPFGEVFPLGTGTERADGQGATVRTLQGGGHSGGHHSRMTILQVEETKGNSQGMRAYHSAGISMSLKSSGGGGSAKTPIIYDDYNDRITDDVGSVRATFGNDASRNGVKLVANQKIRRLTPIECERLQGFPDGWTVGVSDTQRYKMMGNAVTVNVIQAIGERILETERGA